MPNAHEITWIGSNLGITTDRGGLEATQVGDFTVINVGEEIINPKADIIASLPLYAVPEDLLNKISTVIEEIVKEDNGRKSRVVIHDEYGIERSALVAAWTIHKTSGVSLDDAYSKIQEKNKKVINYSNWIKFREKEIL
jgi:hypothetical protein